MVCRVNNKTSNEDQIPKFDTDDLHILEVTTSTYCISTKISQTSCLQKDKTRYGNNVEKTLRK